MQNIVLEILANIMRCYAIYRFMELLYQPKENRKSYKMLPYIFLVILTSGGFYLFHNVFVNIMTNILGLLLITTMYKGTLWKKGLLVAAIYVVNIVVESLVFFSLSSTLKVNGIKQAVYECLTSMGIFFCVILLERTIVIKKYEFQMNLQIWMSLFFVPFISIIIILDLIGIKFPGVREGEIEIAGILVMNLLIFYLYGAMQDYCQQKIEREETLNKMKAYSNQLEVMKTSYQRMKEMKHDLKHHIMEMEYLAKNYEADNIIRYIQDMKIHLSNPNEYVYSGNTEIDSTLNYLLQNAKQVLNTVETKISIPDELEIHSFTWNVILGNLLENAIYASKASVDKYLKVKIKVKQGILYLQIENSFDKEIKMKHQKLLTRKKDKELHGIGLESVKRIVEEKEGIMTIEWIEDRFYVNVMMYLNNIMT